MQIQITLLACLPPLLSLSPCLPFCHAPLLLSMHSPGLLLCCQLKNDSKSITAGQGGQGKQARPQSDRWSWSWSCRRGGGGWVSGSWRSINNSCGMFYGRSSKPFHTHTRTPRWVCKRDFQMLTACQRSWAFIGMSMLMSDHTWHPPPPGPPPLLLTPQGRALSMARVIARQIDGQSSISLVVWPLAIITASPQCPQWSPPASVLVPARALHLSTICLLNGCGGCDAVCTQLNSCPPSTWWGPEEVLVTGYWSLACGVGTGPGNMCGKCDVCGICRMPALHLQLAQGQKGCNRYLH